MYKESANAAVRYLAPRHMLYPEVDAEMWDFLCITRSKNIPNDGPMLQSGADESAMKHHYNTFTASNGWLKSFCIRHQIKFPHNLVQEHKSVMKPETNGFKKYQPLQKATYELKDIYNCVETSIFSTTVLGTACYTSHFL